MTTLKEPKEPLEPHATIEPNGSLKSLEWFSLGA
jgi:hypothetical protein